MRGKVPQPGVEGCRLGITPACAGKRRSVSAVQIAHQDHPRVCGEKHRCCVCTTQPQGSPPRVRGKAFRGCIFLRYARITPACAGKSGTVQPMRVPPGITPAYAGKRDRPRSGPGTTRDHPRVCGEKTQEPTPKAEYEGSPPRMRGKGPDPAGCSTHTGITPACAGKSTAVLPQPAEGRDHPRVCGEKRTTAGRSSGACAATSNAIGMVTSALYRSAMSYTKEHSRPTCTNPSPGAHPSATMTAWASPYRQACTVGHTGTGAEQQHRNARHIIHGCFLRAGWSSGQGRRLCRGQCPDTASPGTLPGRSPAGCPHRSPPAM